MNNAVLRRELRRLLPSKSCWAIAILMGLLLNQRLDSASGSGFLLAVGAACLSLYWAHRSMQAELEEETIEHLGTLPIPPLAIVFQIGLASAAAALAFSLTALLIACPAPLSDALRIWVRGAAVALALGWLGAMGAFRYGETLLGSLGAMGPMAFVLGAAFALEVAVLGNPDTPLAVIGTVAIGAGATLTCYRAWLALGGQWVESIIPRPDARRAKPREPGEPPESITPAPDWSSPVFWYELCANRFQLGLAVGLPCALILLLGLCGYVTEGLQEVVFSLGVSMGTLGVTLMASGRAAQHRRTGLWTDLAVTPLSTRRIVIAQLAGTYLRCALILLAWMGSAVIAAGFDVRGGLAGVLVVLFAAWVVAVVAGYLAGALTTGWKAGLLGVFLLYLSMCITPFLSWALWHFAGYSRFNSGADWLALPVIGLWTVCMFYGCVRRVASFQA